MRSPRPPVILSTFIASLILVILLIFITWHTPANSVHAADNSSSKSAPPSQANLQSQSISPQDSSTSVQAVIPNQPNTISTNLPASQAADQQSISFDSFVQQVKDGQPDVLTGVYVEGLFALKVVPQPTGDVGFVSTDPGTTTQFQLTSAGVTGLLAHNVLDGAKFLDLKPGQEIRLVDGDGSIHRYQVEDLRDFQRLDRSDLQSDFIDTQTGTKLTSQQVFDVFYQGDPHLTLQTCIAKDGLLDWGVRFIVARPLS